MLRSLLTWEVVKGLWSVSMACIDAWRCSTGCWWGVFCTWRVDAHLAWTRWWWPTCALADLSTMWTKTSSMIASLTVGIFWLKTTSWLTTAAAETNLGDWRFNQVSDRGLARPDVWCLQDDEREGTQSSTKWHNYQILFINQFLNSHGLSWREAIHHITPWVSVPCVCG